MNFSSARIDYFLMMEGRHPQPPSRRTGPFSLSRMRPMRIFLFDTVPQMTKKWTGGPNFNARSICFCNALIGAFVGWTIAREITNFNADGHFDDIEKRWGPLSFSVRRMNLLPGNISAGWGNGRELRLV